MLNRLSVLVLLGLLTVCREAAYAADLSECAKGAEPLRPLATDELVVLGEIHGTAETPAIVTAHVCALLQAGRKVVLALEVSTEEQERIDAFLASSGEAPDVSQLLSGSHWTKATEHQDGRSSEGMLSLMQTARYLAQTTRRLRVVAFDQWRSDTPRDEMMARNVERASQSLPGYSVVVLVGNIHAIGTRGSPFDPDFESMTYRLRGRSPRTVNVVPSSGEAWFCSPKCGPHQLPNLPDAPQDTVLKFGTSPMPGFAGTLFLPRTTASPPAVRPSGAQ